MAASTGRYRVTITVPGARKIQVRQQKRGWDFWRARWRVRYETLEHCSHSGEVDLCRPRTRSGWRWFGDINYEYRDRLKIIATYGRGASAFSKTWRVEITEPTELVFTCLSCIEVSTPPPVFPRPTTPSPRPAWFTRPSASPFSTQPPKPSGTRFKPTAKPGLFLSRPNPFLSSSDDGGVEVEEDTVTIKTASGDERTVEVYTVEGLKKPTDTADIEETVEVAEEEIDALLDEGFVVEITNEVTVVMDSVQGIQTTSTSTPAAAPGLDKELLYPGAGAAVGAVAGKLLADNALLGALAGGVAGWWAGRDT